MYMVYYLAFGTNTSFLLQVYNNKQSSFTNMRPGTLPRGQIFPVLSYFCIKACSALLMSGRINYMTNILCVFPTFISKKRYIRKFQVKDGIIILSLLTLFFDAITKICFVFFYTLHFLSHLHLLGFRYVLLH